eukprot:TRINITY_DN1621_c0_g1_i1.p1 TRINITY_DN1621_c0_g1~~TRINITY_DN1621_c0_g1_i1.p1  ORF type:complete len:446 (+),score=83.65 TRINITY_DN1621_c0_g1_i1:219-1556(+)
MRFSLHLSLLCFIVVVFNFIHPTNALIHKLSINEDNRKHFFIENFGFEEKGVINVTIKNWKFNGEPWDPSSASERRSAAFLVKITDTDSTAFLEQNDDYNCILTEEDYDSDPSYLLIYMDNSALTTFHKVIEPESEGFYNIYFINCVDKKVSFELDLEMYNIDMFGNKSFLSAGQSQLPIIYGTFTAVYGVLLIIWIFGFIRGKASVNRLHWLMTALILVKMLSLLFQSIETHFIKATGHPNGWEIAYYIFAVLKTTMFFVLIALIGTGFSFIKPFLTDKDKRIFMVVIPLQVLDNIAMIIVGETAPGSQTWLTWQDIFRLVDIICCGAVLIPIIWSIKHLREASQIDGKAALNLQKLKLFRQFYLIVVSYIYFTRIIIYLLDATLPFNMVWLGEFFSEAATLVFFCTVGYKFRPAEDNPYFKMPSSEDADTIRMEEMAGTRTDD